jgi:hypothetical protein
MLDSKIKQDSEEVYELDDTTLELIDWLYRSRGGLR